MLSEAKTLRQSYKASMLAVMLVFCLIAATMLTTTALRPGLAYGEDAVGDSVGFTDYNIEVDANQNVILTFTYGDTVNFGMEAPAVKVVMHGTTSYPVPVPFENTFKVTVAATSGYSSISDGLITLDSDMDGVTIGNDGTIALPISSTQSEGVQYFPKTVIPIGVTVSNDVQGNDEIEVTVNGLPRTNGMIHVGIYYKNALNQLVPIWSDTSTNTDPIQIFTYTAFVDSFNPSQPSDQVIVAVAKSIAYYVSIDSNFDNTEYSIVANDDAGGAGKVKVTSASGQDLYLLIFDDNLIKAIRAQTSPVDFNYPGLLVQQNGILPLYPY